MRTWIADTLLAVLASVLITLMAFTGTLVILQLALRAVAAAGIIPLLSH